MILLNGARALGLLTYLEKNPNPKLMLPIVQFSIWASISLLTGTMYFLIIVVFGGISKIKIPKNKRFLKYSP